MTVGVRELKARLSHYLELARKGEEILVTSRGRPVARLVAGRPIRRRGIEAILADLEAEGLIDPPARAGRRLPRQPVAEVQGAPLSETVRALRR
jgi:prevent-host-death family protein